MGVRRAGFLDYVGDAWKTYGDFFEVRIAGKRLFFAMHPDAVTQVTVKESGSFDKMASYEGVRKFLTGDGLVAARGSGDIWKQQRKLMAPFFTPSGIRTFADQMVEDSLELAGRWRELAEREEPVEIGHEMTRVTASIILGTMFGTNSIESIDRMKDAVEAMVSFVNQRMVGIPVPLWVPTGRNRRYVAARDLVHDSISKLIAERRATDPSEWPDDLLSRLMRAEDEETGYTMSSDLLRDEAITIFFAGHETTARTLTFAFYALAANPEVERDLHEELDRVLGGRSPTVDDLHALPYTLQVVKEVLRLYPAAPFYVRDAVEPVELGGYEIAAGTGVMLSPYYTHRHPDFWEEPDRFEPERWTEEREKARHRRAYHPFASGARICIGNNFSLLETHLVMATLAQQFAPRLVAGYQPKWEMESVLALKGGLPMHIDRR